MTEQSPSEQLSMARHPDIMALRERYDRVSESGVAKFVEGLAFMAGGYAAVSAWVVGFHTQSAALGTNNLITGIAVALLAYGFGTAYQRTHGMVWVLPLLGIWLIISPWAVRGVDRTTGVLVSNIVVGACVVLLGLAAFMMGEIRSRR